MGKVRMRWSWRPVDPGATTHGYTTSGGSQPRPLHLSNGQGEAARTTVTVAGVNSKAPPALKLYASQQNTIINKSLLWPAHSRLSMNREMRNRIVMERLGTESDSRTLDLSLVCTEQLLRARKQPRQVRM